MTTEDRSAWKGLTKWFWSALGATVVAVGVTWAVYAFGPSGSPPPKPGLPLGRASSSWGKPIPGSSGWVNHRDNQRGVLAGHIELTKLEPNHLYALSLNGKPPHPSNALLPDGHLDFDEVVTDAKGGVTADFSVNLPAGSYEVKFFVKDPTDWKVVLYNDLLRFTVQ